MQERKDAAKLEEIKGLVKIKLAERCKDITCYFLISFLFIYSSKFIRLFPRKNSRSRDCRRRI